jgi:amino acid adenylation domain-containing protein
VFFTSGTSGKPKAVLGTHAGLSHFIDWQRHETDITPLDRVSQLTSPSFDVVLRELLLPLTSGATLCLPHEALPLTAPETVAWLVDQRITVLHAVPTLAESWLARSASELDLPDVRSVFFAGEPLTGDLIRRWRRRFGTGATLVNLYGPTETTLAKFAYRVPADPSPGIQPAGVPLPHCEAYIVDPAGRLCRPGATGQIVIRCPFRTRGYLNAPDDQRLRFVVNPYRADPEDLLYFTGDLGRLSPDGLLEIGGRLDDQVKIKGVRVEPAEVAAVLAGHPTVHTCAVLAIGAARGEPGPTALLAYWIAAPGQRPAADSLECYLRQRLPKEMVPARFIEVQELPVGRNGKLDVPRLRSRIYARGEEG